MNGSNLVILSTLQQTWYLYSSPEGQVMQLVGDFELEEIVNSEEVEHPAVHACLEERVLVLGQAHVVQPSGHPLH